MDQLQGEHMMYGAGMAAEEINDTTDKIKSNGTNFEVEIIEVDTDEIDDPDHAADAVVDALLADEPDVCVGGFRTEAVSDYIGDIMEAETIFFITGAATYSLISASGYEDPGYKYVFRATPFNDIFLVNNCYLMFAMVARRIQGEMGYTATPTATPPYYVTWSQKVKIAIFTENLSWAAAMRQSAQDIIGGPLAEFFGWELVDGGAGHENGEWAVSDNPELSVVSDALGEIKAADAQIIFTILSGPVGLTFAKAYGTSDVPAIPVGINVEAQDPSYWEDTYLEAGKYGAENIITMGTWAPNVSQTSLTLGFLERFAAYTLAEEGEALFPTYTASTYDVIHTIKKAIEETNAATWDAGTETATLDNDAIIGWLENLGNAQVISTGKVGYYPKHDGATYGQWKGIYPMLALNTSQLDAIYKPEGTLMYDAASSNFTMPPYTTHDLIYGPRSDATDPDTGWVTGIAIQWQDDGEGNGVQIGVWPQDGYDTPIGGAALKLSTTISKAVTGLLWTNEVTYPGIVDFDIPQWMKDEW